MLTRSSVQFLFDSCLIPVHSPFTPIQFPFNPCHNPVVFSTPYFLLNFLPKTLLPLPFASNPLFPLPDKFPLYNIIMCLFSSLPSLPPSSCIKILLSLSPLRFYPKYFQKNPLLYLSLIS